MVFRLLAIILSLYFGKLSFVNAQSDVNKLVQAMLEETDIEEDLHELCDEIGGRVTGSIANEQAVEWAYNKFKKSSLQVIKDPFEMPSLWLPESTLMQITGEVAFNATAVAKYHTPSGVFEGKIIHLNKGTKADFDSIEHSLEDYFVLVSSELCLDIGGLFQEYTDASEAETNAREYGAKGIIFMSSRPKGLLYRFITNKPNTNALPQYILSREDANRCIRLLEQGKNLETRIENRAIIGDSYESNNVIAEIKGSEKPDEVIIIGAHLDSWALGTGANDNGCNVSMLIDIARQMQALKITPKRTIRFALWNGEEQGYFGSWDYCLDHQDDLDNHIMAMSIDIGSGDIIGFFTNGREELIPIVDKLLKPVDTLSSYLQINAPIIGTDNFDFMLEGIPNLVANHKPAGYGINYHASSDTYDKVDLKALKSNSAIIAAVTLGFANLSEEDAKVLNRNSRAEIQKIFEDNKTEFSMRMFNVWDPWMNGERGRK